MACIELAGKGSRSMKHPKSGNSRLCGERLCESHEQHDGDSVRGGPYDDRRRPVEQLLQLWPRVQGILAPSQRNHQHNIMLLLVEPHGGAPRCPPKHNLGGPSLFGQTKTTNTAQQQSLALQNNTSGPCIPDGGEGISGEGATNHRKVRAPSRDATHRVMLRRKIPETNA